MNELQKAGTDPAETPRVATADQVQSRRDNFWSTMKGYRELRELPDGYELFFPRTHKWLNQLEQFKSNISVQIPIFEVELIDDVERQIIRVVIRTTHDGKDYLEKWIMGVQKFRSRRIAKANRSLALASRVLTSPFRVLPDFVIIGAARCGTTSLYSWLTTHPGVASAYRKETYYFDQTYRRGLGWYRAFFPTKSQKRKALKSETAAFVTGEATPDYLFHPHAPKRMHETLPQAKLIVVLRNPVRRAYSNYILHLRRSIESLSFEEAIECEAQRLEGEYEKMLNDEHYFSYNRQNFSYLSRGIYLDQLQRWMTHYSREQMLILSSEELIHNLGANSKKIVEFLGIPPWNPPARKKAHSVPYVEMSRKTRDYLEEYFKPHNQRLYDFLGRDFGW